MSYGVEDLASPFTKGYRVLVEHLFKLGTHDQSAFLPQQTKIRKHVPKVHSNRKARRRMQIMSRRRNRV